MRDIWAVPIIVSILILGGFGFTQEVFADHISSVPASPFIGPIEVRPCCNPGQNSAQPYDTTGNLAYQGGLAQPAVASTSIHVQSPVATPIHQPQFANDGFYGNGASWVGFDQNPWLKVDLGDNVVIDTITFGRDRVLGFDDRDPGQFTVSISSNDVVYANGDDSGDAGEYTQIVDSSGHFSGIINGPETIQVIFDPVNTRFIKVEFANAGTLIDELQVFGAQTITCGADTELQGTECVVTQELRDEITDLESNLVVTVNDAVADFSPTENTDTSTWSYRFSADEINDGIYDLMTVFGQITSFGGLPELAWSEVPNVPNGVSVNTSGGPLTIFDQTNAWPDNTIWMHPKQFGGFTVVSWLATQDGTADVSYSFNHIGNAGTGIGYFVDLGATTLESGSLLNGESTGTQTIQNVDVSSGDRIYFIVSTGPNNDWGFDSTALKATVTFVAPITCGDGTVLVGNECIVDPSLIQELEDALTAALADLAPLQEELDQALLDFLNTFAELTDALATITGLETQVGELETQVEDLETEVEELGLPGGPVANQGEGQGVPAQGKNNKP